MLSCKSADKSVNAHQIFANFRYGKETQVTEHNYLSQEEEAKFERDGKELGWFTPYKDAKRHNPNRQVTHYIKQIILAKLRYKNYARSNAIGVRLGEKEQAVIACELEDKMYIRFWVDVQLYNGETRTAASPEQRRMR